MFTSNRPSDPYLRAVQQFYLREAVAPQTFPIRPDPAIVKLARDAYEHAQRSDEGRQREPEQLPTNPALLTTLRSQAYLAGLIPTYAAMQKIKTIRQDYASMVRHLAAIWWEGDRQAYEEYLQNPENNVFKEPASERANIEDWMEPTSFNAAPRQQQRWYENQVHALLQWLIDQQKITLYRDAMGADTPSA